jgi:hypothetical protein
MSLKTQIDALATAIGADTKATAAALTSAIALKAPLASPALTGAPTAPTASVATNTTQLATTAFVQSAVAALINGAPGALDTLVELANAFGNDANFAATMTTALAGKQPIDSDLTALAAIAPANDDVIQRKAGAWINRTIAQLKADLGLTGTNSGDQTFFTPRVTPVTSSATPTFNTDTTDLLSITALTVVITSMTSGRTGTLVNGQKLMVRFEAATALAIAWGADYVSSGIASLPTTTVAGKTITVGLVYDSVAAKLVCMAVDAVGY